MDQLCCTIFENVPIAFWWTRIILIRVGFLQMLFVMFVRHKSHGWRSRGRSWRASRVVACSSLSSSLALYSLPVESTGSQHGNNALQSKVFVMCGTRVDHFISSPLFPTSFVGEDFKKMKFFKRIRWNIITVGVIRMFVIFK